MIKKTTPKAHKIYDAYNQNQITKNAEYLAEITHKEQKHAHLGDFKFIDLFAGIEEYANLLKVMYGVNVYFHLK